MSVLRDSKKSLYDDTDCYGQQEPVGEVPTGLGESAGLTGHFSWPLELVHHEEYLQSLVSPEYL